MTRHNSFNNMMDFDPFQNTIGYDRMFDRINRIFADIPAQSKQKYPFYNIIRHSDDDIELELAVAGFSEEDINISVADGILTIEGELQDKVEPEKYLHKGIGSRAFSRKFSLSDTTEVVGAHLENGLLKISLKSIVPDHKKPKQIPISKGGKKELPADKELLIE